MSILKDTGSSTSIEANDSLRFSIIFSQTVDLPEAEPPATPIRNGTRFPI